MIYKKERKKENPKLFLNLNRTTPPTMHPPAFSHTPDPMLLPLTPTPPLPDKDLRMQACWGAIFENNPQKALSLVQALPPAEQAGIESTLIYAKAARLSKDILLGTQAHLHLENLSGRKESIFFSCTDFLLACGEFNGAKELLFTHDLSEDPTVNTQKAYFFFLQEEWFLAVDIIETTIEKFQESFPYHLPTMRSLQKQFLERAQKEGLAISLPPLSATALHFWTLLEENQFSSLKEEIDSLDTSIQNKSEFLLLKALLKERQYGFESSLPLFNELHRRTLKLPSFSPLLSGKNILTALGETGYLRAYYQLSLLYLERKEFTKALTSIEEALSLANQEDFLWIPYLRKQQQQIKTEEIKVNVDSYLNPACLIDDE